MKIAVVLSRPWMRFSPQFATAQELTVHDLLMNLPSSISSKLYVPSVVNPYSGFNIQFFPQNSWIHKWMFLPRLVSALRQDKPDIIIVQQHLGTAYYIAKRLNIPVLIHRHNDYPGPSKNSFKIWWKCRQFKSLAGICFVSAASCRDFLSKWDKYFFIPTFVVPNGMNLKHWTSQEIKKNVIIFVGRSLPEKGVMELAHALQKVLPLYPDWASKFYFGDPNNNPEYREKIISILTEIGAQVSVFIQRPWSEIKLGFEESAIAVVPSIGIEAFGRTALEAMAGGAALISSTRGGLDEVVGNAAIRLSDITPDTIAAALIDLIEHPEKRAELSSRGVVQAQKYAIENQVSAFVKMCDDMICVYTTPKKSFFSWRQV